MVSASRGTIYLMIAQAMFILLGFILNAYLARALSTEEFGILGLVVTASLIFVTFISAGLTGATTKFIAEKNGEQSAADVDRKVTKLLLFGSIICGVLFFFGAEFLAQLVGNSKLVRPFQIAAFLIFTQCFYSQRISILNAFKDFDRQAWALVSLAFSKVLISVVLVVSGFGLIGAIAGQVIAPLVGFLVAGKKQLLDKSKVSQRDLLNYAWPYALTAGLLLVFQSIDIFLVQALVQNEVTTGLYVASNSLARAIVVMLSTVAVGIFPSISSLTSSKSTKTNQYLQTVFLLVLAIGVPLCLFIYGGANNLLAIFYSEKYIGAAPFLELLAISSLFMSLVFIAIVVFNAAGETKKALRIMTLVVLLQIVLTFSLVRQFDAIGGAYAALVTGIISALFVVYLLSHKFGSMFRLKSLGKLLISGIVSFLILLVIQGLLQSKWMLLPAMLVACIVYGVLIALFKLFSPAEVTIINSVVPKIFQSRIIEFERLFGY